jgi:hypothetical protein
MGGGRPNRLHPFGLRLRGLAPLRIGCSHKEAPPDQALKSFGRPQRRHDRELIVPVLFTFRQTEPAVKILFFNIAVFRKTWLITGAAVRHPIRTR